LFRGHDASPGFPEASIQKSPAKSTTQGTSIFGKLLEPINRQHFKAIVERHNGDAYDKSFDSLDHLVALIFAQFTAAQGLRGLAANWNANAQHHYHLASGKLARSTVSDANQRRPVAVFADSFVLLANQLDGQTRREGRQMVQLIDSTPVPLGKLCDWARSNGRIKGMKMHAVYDPEADCPRLLGITDANVNDAEIGRSVALRPGAIYVFDKGYCHYRWWQAIDAAGSSFVTRPKTNMRLARIGRYRRIETPDGDGFSVLSDAEVQLASRGDSELPIRLRRLRVSRHQGGGTITLLSNDMHSSAVEIATLYKGRWQIELLFRWIKQHLKIGKFLGHKDDAIRLQLIAAMIAYALLRIAAPHAPHCHPDPALYGSRHPMPVRAPRYRRHRAPPRQSKPKTKPELTRSVRIRTMIHISPDRPAIWREQVATMMRRMAIEAVYRRPHTSKPADRHKVFPYLLRGMTIERPNQAWAMGIT
jgi:putative transposase